jgi:hypothetical protein
MPSTGTDGPQNILISDYTHIREILLSLPNGQAGFFYERLDKTYFMTVRLPGRFGFLRLYGLSLDNRFIFP